MTMELRETLSHKKVGTEEHTEPAHVARLEPIDEYIKKVRKWLTFALVIVVGLVMLVQTIKGGVTCPSSTSPDQSMMQTDRTSQLVTLLNHALKLSSFGSPSIGAITLEQNGTSHHGG